MPLFLWTWFGISQLPKCATWYCSLHYVSDLNLLYLVLDLKGIHLLTAAITMITNFFHVSAHVSVKQLATDQYPSRTRGTELCITLGPVSWRPTTVKWRQFSQSNRHSTIGTRQTQYMKRYHRRRTTRWGVTARSPTMVTLHDTRFVECRWWNDGWTVKTDVTWRSSASMIPAPGADYDRNKLFTTRLHHQPQALAWIGFHKRLSCPQCTHVHRRAVGWNEFSYRLHHECSSRILYNSFSIWLIITSNRLIISCSNWKV